jgi:hypothetical protein
MGQGEIKMKAGRSSFGYKTWIISINNEYNSKNCHVIEETVNQRGKNQVNTTIRLLF